MTDTLVPAPTHCTNCGTSLSGEYCAYCGQSIKTPRRFFLSLINEALENLFQLDSRAVRTLSQTLFKPGMVPKNYLAGKRASYVHPLRFYIVTSIVFFVVLSVINFVANFDPLAESSTDNLPASEQSLEATQPEPSTEPESHQSASAESEERSSAVGSSNLAEGSTNLAEGSSNDAEPTEQEAANRIKVDLSFWDSEEGRQVEAYFKRQADKATELAQADPGSIISTMLEIAPPLMFVFMPILAMFIHMLFIGKNTFYAEHLIYVVYTHCFLFLALSLTSISDALAIDYVSSIVSGSIFIWIPIYLVWGLKRAYSLTAWGTAWRSALISLAYAFLLIFGTTAVALIGLVTL